MACARRRPVQVIRAPARKPGSCAARRARRHRSRGRKRFGIWGTGTPSPWLRTGAGTPHRVCRVGRRADERRRSGSVTTAGAPAAPRPKAFHVLPARRLAFSEDVQWEEVVVGAGQVRRRDQRERADWAFGRQVAHFAATPWACKPRGGPQLVASHAHHRTPRHHLGTGNPLGVRWPPQDGRGSTDGNGTERTRHTAWRPTTAAGAGSPSRPGWTRWPCRRRRAA